MQSNTINFNKDEYLIIQSCVKAFYELKIETHEKFPNIQKIEELNELKNILDKLNILSMIS